ncbi:CRISPR-associated protein Csx15 [Moorellaceae bacterium AZ2]
MYLFNLSGHTPPRGSEEFDVIVNRDIPNIPPVPEAVARQAFELVNSLPQDVVREGGFEIILPGMTPLAAAVLAVIHSRYGQFPSIRFAVRQSDGTFKLSGRIDLQGLRLESSALRS